MREQLLANPPTDELKRCCAPSAEAPDVAARSLRPCSPKLA